MADDAVTPLTSTLQATATSAGPSCSVPLDRASTFSVDVYQGGEIASNDLSKLCAHSLLPSLALTKKLGAEFVGTFVLIFAAAGSAIVNEKTDGGLSPVGLAVTPGLAVMVIIFSTGHISGAHLNPSVTVAFAALGNFPWIQVPLYICAQVSASICASFALRGVFHPDLYGGVTIPSGSYWQTFILEFVITFNLMFVVTAVATDTRAVGELAGIAVGGTVMLNILISGTITGGSMNPVRTLGPAIATNKYGGMWVYIVGPSLGALAGAAAYSAVRLRGEDLEEVK